MAAAAVLFGVAILCRVIVYRRGAKWHQRWEPFAADVASALILLPLLGYGYELPPRPAAPSGLRLGRIDVANVAGRSEGGAQFDIPQTSVTGVGLSLPGGVRNAVAFDVANVQIPAVDITASDSSRVTLDQTLVENVNVMFDRGRMEISGVSAHASFGGAFESDAVWREFRNIEFLRGVNNPVDRMAFDFDLTVAGPDLRPQVRQTISRIRQSDRRKCRCNSATGRVHGELRPGRKDNFETVDLDGASRRRRAKRQYSYATQLARIPSSNRQR